MGKSVGRAVEVYACQNIWKMRVCSHRCWKGHQDCLASIPELGWGLWFEFCPAWTGGSYLRHLKPSELGPWVHRGHLLQAVQGWREASVVGMFRHCPLRLWVVISKRGCETLKSSCSGALASQFTPLY